MDISFPDDWPTLGTILDLIVSTCLMALDAVNHAVQSIGPSLWCGLKWVGHKLSVAGNAVLAAVLVFLLWIFIIYLCCLAISLVCRLARRRERRLRRERQPLLCTTSGRRRQLFWTSSNSVGESRRNYERMHRDLYRIEIGRRRQDQLRREQTRTLEIRDREDRMRQQRTSNHQHVATHMYGQHETIITWLRTSSSLNTVPDYGTLSPTPAPSRPDPPPPYLQSTNEQPPPYSNRRTDLPPAYD